MIVLMLLQVYTSTKETKFTENFISRINKLKNIREPTEMKNVVNPTEMKITDNKSAVVLKTTTIILKTKQNNKEKVNVKIYNKKYIHNDFMTKFLCGWIKDKLNVNIVVKKSMLDPNAIKSTNPVYHVFPYYKGDVDKLGFDFNIIFVVNIVERSDADKVQYNRLIEPNLHTHNNF